jgi:hypothetical protein
MNYVDVGMKVVKAGSIYVQELQKKLLNIKQATPLTF